MELDKEKKNKKEENTVENNYIPFIRLSNYF